jgi:cysteine synthase A
MQSYESLPGNTPLIRISFRRGGGPVRSVFAKLEWCNPTGSIKDRMAAYIFARAEEQGALRPGQPVVEMTSGNTGIAVAALGALTGHPVHIFMPDWMSVERVRLLRLYGAEVHLVTAAQGGFSGAKRMAEEAAGEMDAFRPAQFENDGNPLAHYYGTGAELARQLPEVAAFAAGVGTGGTLMGVARRLTRAEIIAVEPAEAPALSRPDAPMQPHRIEGIGDGFVPRIVERRRIHRVTEIDDGDAVRMAARLSAELGLGAGISSGANFLGAALAAETLPGAVATVFPDDSKKYLTGALAHPPAAEPGALSETFELLDWEKIG